jgi:hypothetical protein
VNRASLEQAEVRAQEIGRLLKSIMPLGWGFVLAMFSIGEKGVTTFISDLRREDVIKAIRELADKLERGEKQL